MKDISQKLENAVVAIAGLGGLGSNVAVCLARTGVGKLIIADFDDVEKSNLNRQHYFLDQVGKSKVECTIENLKRINPDLEIEAHKEKLTGQNIPVIFSKADIIAECFDKADQKQMIVETVLTKMKDAVIVSASGMAGYGKSNEVQTRKINERLILVGDNKSGIDSIKILTAGRVGLVACHQANAIIEVLLDG